MAVLRRRRSAERVQVGGVGLGSPAMSAPLRDSPVAVLPPPPAIGGVGHTSVAYTPFLADGGEVREYR